MFLNFHTHHYTGQSDVIEIVNSFWHESITTPFGSIGNHPAFLSNLVANEAELAKATCIGEAGLDKVCATDWKLQVRAFKAQIQVAERLKKPLILHCVRAFQEISQLKKEYKPKMPWVLHGFDKNTLLAAQLAREGFYFSLGASLVKKHEKWAEVLSQIPPHKVFLETDCQTEIDIKSIYDAYAKLKNISIESVEAQIMQNFLGILNSPPQFS